MINAPSNLIRRDGGFVLPNSINWPTKEIPEEWPILATGVHTNVLVFGYHPFLQQLCNELRERTLPEICAFVVGTVKVRLRILVGTLCFGGL